MPTPSFCSSPLGKVQDHLLHAAAQGRRFFNFYVPLRFDGTHMRFLRVITLFLPKLLRSLRRQFATWVIWDSEQTSGNSCATAAQGIVLCVCTRHRLMESGNNSKTIFLREGRNTLQCFKAQRVVAVFLLGPPCATPLPAIVGFHNIALIIPMCWKPAGLQVSLLLILWGAVKLVGDIRFWWPRVPKLAVPVSPIKNHTKKK